MMQNTDVQNKNESKMDEYSSIHTRGAQIPGAWLTILYVWWCLMFSALLYICQPVYTQCLQFYIVIIIVKCNTSVFTLVLHSPNFTILC